jgi:hypothetical protein
MKQILYKISFRTIAGSVLGIASVFGGLISCAGGDAYGIFAMLGLIVSLLLGCAAYRLIVCGLLRREPLARRMYHFYK